MSSSKAEKEASRSRVRLNRYIALAGVCSRREADRLISQGEVRVNGRRVDELGLQVNPQRDEVKVQGELIRATFELTYILLNKPPGYVTTVKDEKGRPTIRRLVRTPVRVFPVGRLDLDSEGLLLMTNDGELAFRLTHPRYKIPKIYEAFLDQPAESSVRQQFAQGVAIDRGRPARGVLEFTNPADHRFCRVTITEGRNRQVRKMFAAVGYRVKGLQRIQLGSLRLGKQQPGTWRYLSQAEINALLKAVGLKNGDPK